jgi:imidazolonepropionase-like amidohydrolase
MIAAMGVRAMTRILLTNVKIFDGTGTPSFAGEVLVEGNRIGAVKKAPQTIERGGAEVVDGGGATLMPGMVEAHAHLSWLSSVERIVNVPSLPPEEHLLITARNARITLDYGFTSAY